MVSHVRTPQQMKCVLTTAPGLRPPAPPNYSLFIIVIILQEVGHIRSDGTQISPETFSCHAEENIKNTDWFTPAQQ